MPTALVHSEDQIRSELKGWLSGKSAPFVDVDACRIEPETSHDPREHEPEVNVGWARMGLEKSRCDPSRSDVEEWEWYAEVRWNCVINTAKYIQALLNDPLIIPGTTNSKGRKTSPDTLVRITSIENTRRPEHGSSKGSKLDLELSIGRIP